MIKKLIKSNEILYRIAQYWRFRMQNRYFDRLKEAQYPDVLKRRYKKATGKELNLENPITFNEKIQWLKLYDRDPLKTELADKYRVRKWVAERVGEEYLIPLLGVWNNANDIDFDALPDQFVLKTNHGCGFNIIVRDKGKLNLREARKKLNTWLKIRFGAAGFELQYLDIEPVIIAEKYMSDENQKELVDYKFYCFGGKVEFLYISIGLENHETARMSFFDLNGNRLPMKRDDYLELGGTIRLPSNFGEMKNIAKALSRDVAFLRVDLYEINERIYFGELTFTPTSGFAPFKPPEWDDKLGELLVLPRKVEKQ